MNERSSESVGTFCLVLHSHLPWVAHHGNWPVGEEWLYQAWAESYVPVVEVLDRLAQQGHRNLLTLGVTPVLAAQLDDAYCLEQFRTWLGFWQQRASHFVSQSDTDTRPVAVHELQLANHRAQLADTRWRHGAAPVFRSLADAGTIELLGGPAAHGFQPLLDDPVATFALNAGLDDARIRLGREPAGIWAPECGYRPGLEHLYAEAGVTHFMVDGPTLRHVGRDHADAWTVGDTGVVAFGRDLEVSYRVWSPRRGYPGGPFYRDFHAFNHEFGIRDRRVTSTRTPNHEKAPYDPDAGLHAVEADAQDFVDTVVRRLRQLSSERGRPGLVVAAYDTELFGHWWHEGPVWLERILQLLPEAGVNVTTLQGAIESGAVAGRVDPENGSWGSNKDWSVWNGEAVTDLVADNDQLQRDWRKLVADHASTGRDTALDQLARDALMALSSDWAFMVTKDSAADYARERHRHHHESFRRLARAIETNSGETAHIVATQRAIDGPFGWLDGRTLNHAIG